MTKKKSLEQFVAGLDLEVRSIPLDLIDYDEANPNEVPPDLYEALKTDIRDYGFWQPILVTPVGERYRMIDGEHRHRIVGELGGTAIPSVIADEMEADEARFRLITMNRFRGAFKPLPLAELLAGLTDSYSEAQIRQRIGMDEAQLRDTLALASFTDDLGDLLRDELDQERLEAPVVLRFVVNQRDGEIIDRVVAAAASDKIDRGQALAKVCTEYERTHKPKAKESK